MKERFTLALDYGNKVRFIDCLTNKDLLAISFNNLLDAMSCKNALMYHCNLMNNLYTENQELNNLKNLCRDYNIKLEDIYDIVEKAIEKRESEN